MPGTLLRISGLVGILLFMTIFALLPYVLQLLLIIHIIKNRKPFLWLWLLVFLPYIGGLAYIIVELLPELPHNISVGDSLAQALHPEGSISQLEEQVKHQDTVTNRTLLADAYCSSGRYDEALALYDSCLSGPYSDDRELQFKKINATAAAGRKEEAKAAMAQFKEQGELASAEQVLLDLKLNDDYDKMKDIFFRTSNFEVGYLCALHFHEEGKDEEAQAILAEMSDCMNRYRYLRKTDSRQWYVKTKHLLG